MSLWAVHELKSWKISRLLQGWEEFKKQKVASTKAKLRITKARQSVLSVLLINDEKPSEYSSNLLCYDLMSM